MHILLLKEILAQQMILYACNLVTALNKLTDGLGP